MSCTVTLDLQGKVYFAYKKFFVFPCNIQLQCV